MSSKILLTRVLIIPLISCLIVSVSEAQIYKTESIIIDDDDANILIHRYDGGDPTHVPPCPNNSCQIGIAETSNPNLRLFSVTFKATVLRDILNQQVGGKPCDNLALMFGLDNTQTSGRKWHLLALGMFDETLITRCQSDNIECPHIYDGSINATALNTATVDQTTAQRWMDDFKTFTTTHPNLKTYRNCNNLRVPLLGFYFNAQHIAEIILNNASNTNPDRVIFAIGVEPGPGGGAGNWKYHVIAYGQNFVNNSVNNLRQSSSTYPDASVRPPSIYDKADPYPPR